MVGGMFYICIKLSLAVQRQRHSAHITLTKRSEGGRPCDEMCVRGAPRGGRAPRAERSATALPRLSAVRYLVPLHIGWVGNNKPFLGRKASYTII